MGQGRGIFSGGEGKGYKYIDLAGGQRPGVLTHVANGLGKTTDLEYTTSTSFMLKAAAAGPGWSSFAPMPIHVVSRVTESDNLEIVGRPAGHYVTEYSYQDPVYDGRQREFRGFKHAESRRIGDDNSPTSISTSEFLSGECEDEVLADGTQLCAPENRWRDHGREALKGLPYLTETRDETLVYPSTEHNTYRLRHVYRGLDGRIVGHAFASQVDGWIYDTARGHQDDAAPPGAQAAKEVEFEDEVGHRKVSGDEERGIMVRGTTGRVHTRTETLVDGFGNATAKIARGCTDCTTVDETIESHTEPGRPDGDLSGWLWRTVKSWTQGSNDQERRHQTSIVYNLQGDPVDTTAELHGTMQLDRTHAAERLSAPTPSDASGGGDSPVPIPVLHEERDQFGNVKFQSGPNGRCRYIGHLEPYAELATSETVRAGSTLDLDTDGCGKVALVSSAEYDRGFGLVTDVKDLHEEPSKAEYDAFGRITALTRPSPYAAAGEPPGLSALPSITVEYILADVTGKPYSIIHTQTQDGADHDAPDYQDGWAYVDGLGRGIVSLVETDQTDPNAGNVGKFIANGLTEYDNKGAARRAFLAWFYDGDPMKFPLATPPPSPYGRQRYDAFGRQIQTFGLDGSVTLMSVYHGLGQDKWDAADLAPGPHQGTPASVLSDGHWRPIVMTERIHVNEAIEERQTITGYLSTGEIGKITRRRAGSPDVVRWMAYDTLGRRVLNVEPNTSKNFHDIQNFHDIPSASIGTLRAWRYAYNDAGDLVGTSDARGCGANYIYDAAGRLLAEDYSPCETAQEDYVAPNLTARTGVEVLYHYDQVDPSDRPADDGPNVKFPVSGRFYLGRLAWVADRASKTLTRYDGRGRVTGVARQIAKPGPPALALAQRYASEWYIRKANFDGADRPIRESTGAHVDELLGTVEPLHEGSDPDLHATDNTSVVTTQYTVRGTVKSVGGSYGSLVSSIQRDADGLVQETVYGDVAGTTTGFNYDNRRRLGSVTTYRGPPPLWTGSPSYSPAPLYGTSAPTTFQLLLQDEEFTYDEVDNPIEIRDWRISSEWPDGAKPVTRKMEYDDLYRVTQVDYEYAADADTWVSPFDAENNGNADPRRAKPVPQISFDKRVLQQRFQYDWLGNTSRTDDDVGGFYDRSLGRVTNDVASGRPYQLKAASNEQTASQSTRKGHLTTRYDDAGNLTRLAVVRSGPCLPGPKCSELFAYEWDEVGRLAEARRWDVDATAAATLTAGSDPPSGGAAAHLLHRYDANDGRVIKTAVDDASTAQRSTLYVFASLELRRADTVAGNYDRANLTEVPYLMAHGVRLARVVYEPGDVPSLDAGKTHVFLELGDHLGSTSAVLDKATSEVVARSTFEAYGAAESDYRPTRWSAFREDHRFTGKEEDVEVGLVYFGARFYAPLLQRWVSADPLAIHGIGADLNAYAYVHGSVLRAVDPLGLAGEERGNSGGAPAVDPNLSGGGTEGNTGTGGEPEASSPPRTVDYQFQEGATSTGLAVKDVAIPAPRGASAEPSGMGALRQNQPNIGASPALQVRTVTNTVLGVGAVGAAGAGAVLVGGAAVIAGGPAVPIIGGGAAVAGTGAAEVGLGTEIGIQVAVRMPTVTRVAVGLLEAAQAPGAPAAVLGAGVAAGGAGALGEAERRSATTGGLCFAAGTLVVTRAGLKSIEDVVAGDEVWARNERSGRETWRRVSETSTTLDKMVMELVFQGKDGTQQIVRLTPEHPLWRLSERTWSRADKVQLTDEVYSLSGPMRLVRSFALSGRHTVYNLTVENDHTYFVGVSGIWSHNKDPWEALAEVKDWSFNNLSKAEQNIARRATDMFQQRYLAGVGEKMSNIRNLNNLGDGLWEIKTAPGVRVYLDKLGNVIGYSNKNNQGYMIPRLKNIMSMCG